MTTQVTPPAHLNLAAPTAPGSSGTASPNQPGPTKIPRKHGMLPEQKPASPRDGKKILKARKIPDNIIRIGEPTRTENVIGTNNPIAIGSIDEQARALRNDLDLIYEYVRDTIKFSPNYGLHKGAIGAMVDGSANAFDQSDLMIQLLSSAGYTAKFVTGTIRLNSAEWSGWLGVDSTNSTAAQTMLAGGGIPVEQDPVTADLLIGHCWVSVEMDGGPFVFDPAFKLHNTVSPIANLASAMDFVSTSDFLSAGTAGEYIGSSYVQNVNDAGTTGKMDHYSSELAEWIKTNNPGARLDDIIGGRTIIAHTGTIRQTSLAYQDSADTPVTDLDIMYKALFQVRYDFDATMGDYHINLTFLTADVYGRLMTLFFNTSRVASLRVAATSYGTSRAQGLNTFADLRFTVTHPYVAVDPQFADEDWTTAIKAGANTAIGYSWGMSSKNISDIHQQNQNQCIANGLADTDEQLLGFSLLLIWDNFIGQASATIDIASRLGNCGFAMHHAVGTVSQMSVTGGKVKSISSFGISYQLSSNVGSSSDVDATGFAASLLVESLEGTAAQQVTGVACADAIRLIREANSNGIAIYAATAANWNPPPPAVSVRGQMASVGYTSDTLADIDDLIANGFGIAMPNDGTMTFGAITNAFYGYVSVNGLGSSMASWTWFGAKGAVSSDYQDDAPTNTAAQDNARQVDSFGMPSATVGQSARVNMLNGRFEYSATDLTVGNQGAPYELSFKRAYNSDLRLAFQGLGYGWSHNWQTFAITNSDGFIPLGDQQVLAAVPAIATLFVLRQVHIANTGLPIDNFVIACIAANHFVEGMVNNVVRLQLGGSTAVFTKLPDGSYLPAMGMHGKSKLEMMFDTSTPPKPYYVYTTADKVVFTYRTDGQLGTVAYPFGVVTTLTYNTAGKLTKVSNGFRDLNFAYDTYGLLHTVNDGNSRTVTLTIDATGTGNLLSVKDPLNNSTTYEYDQRGRLTKVFRPANPTSPILTNVYDSLSRVKEQHDAYDNVWQYFVAGTRSEDLAPNNTSRVMYFNGQGSVVRYVNALGQEWGTSHDGNERAVLATLPEGNSVATTYDADGNSLTVTQNPKPGSGLTPRTTTRTYETTWNKLETTTDPDGNITTYEYVASGLNGAGQVKKITGHTVAAGTPVSEYTYNNKGQTLTATDPTGVVASFAYDATSRDLLSITKDPGAGHLNIVSSFVYDGIGNAISATDPMLNVTTVVLDALRRPVQVTKPTNDVLFSTYDANGNVVQLQSLTSADANIQTVTATYAIDGKPLTITGPTNYGIGAQPIPIRYEYDSLRRAAKLTDAGGHVVSMAFDAAGRAISVALDGVTQQSGTFTANGFVESTTDVKNNTTQYEYDGFDRGIKTIYPDSSFETSAYDSRDNLLELTTRTGLTFTYVYDNANQVVSRTPFGQPTVSFTYDKAGRSLTVSTPTVSGDVSTGTFTTLYDSAGRITGEQGPDGKSVSVSLDNNGRPQQLTYPDNSPVSFAFDAGNRLASVSGFGGSTTFSYDSASRLISRLNGNKTGQGYAYDKTDSLIALSINNLKSGAVEAASRVDFSFTSTDFPFGTHRKVSDQSLVWSPAAMRTSIYAAANDLNQYPSVDAATFSYDTNGCLTGDGQSTYQYDAANRLISVTRGGSTVEFKYDPFGRLTLKTVGGITTRYLYAGLQRIEEYDATGALSKRYVYGSDLDQCLYTVDPSGLLLYLHSDDLGSTVLVTDANGVAVESNVYSPWGEPTAGSLSSVKIGYTGQFYDADADLYYYKARHYSPKLGRFMQPDPIGLAGGMNFYAYCDNDPINNTDPLGLWTGGIAIPLSNLKQDPRAQMYAFGYSTGDGDPILDVGALIASGQANAQTIGSGIGSLGQVPGAQPRSQGEIDTDNARQAYVDMWANVARQAAENEAKKRAAAAVAAAWRAHWKKEGEQGRAEAGRAIDAALFEAISWIMPEIKFAKLATAGSNKAIEVLNAAAALIGRGRRGSAAHQAEVARIEALLKSKGWRHIAGGSKKERAVLTNSGKTRYPDLHFEKPDGTSYYHNVGRVNKNGDMVAREIEAGEDLLNSAGDVELGFTRY